MGETIHRFEKLVRRIGMDEARIVGGACTIESNFVLLHVGFVCQSVYCEGQFSWRVACFRDVL